MIGSYLLGKQILRSIDLFIYFLVKFSIFKKIPKKSSRAESVPYLHVPAVSCRQDGRASKLADLARVSASINQQLNNLRVAFGGRAVCATATEQPTTRDTQCCVNEVKLRVPSSARKRGAGVAYK